MAARQPGGTYRRIAALFTAAFLATVVVLAILGHFGLPDALLGVILGGACLITFMFVGINAGTMEISEFHLAGRSLSAAANGMASAAAIVGGGLYLGLAGLFLADPWSAAGVTVGWALGCLVLAVGVSPYFRKSAAFGVADFLGIRYDSRAVRVAAVAVVVIALFALLAAALATASFVSSLLFGIPESVALPILVVIVLTSTVLGGMRAITLSAIVQYIVLAVAFLVPVAVFSFSEFSFPFPQLTFGFALQEVERTAAMAMPMTGVYLPIGSGSLASLILAVAMGVAALPFLVMRGATVFSIDDARRSAGWTLLFVLIVALAAPAYAAFLQLVAIRDIAGVGLERLPDWLYSWGNIGFVSICGGDAASSVAAIESCRDTPGFTGNLVPADLSISTDAVTLAAPAAFDIPYVGTALLYVGAIAASLATANAAAFAAASAAGHDFYGGVLDTRASAGRQLVVTRAIMVGLVLLAAWVAAARADDAFGLALSALSLSAGSLFPALILAIWWKRANATGALAGIIAGAAVVALIALQYRYPGSIAIAPLHPDLLGVNELTAAVIAAPVSFAAIVAGSLASSAPSAEDAALVDAIRRPGGTPFIQEIESR